jgi:hypothetical protein
MDSLGFAKHVHTYLGEFIRAADQKAAFTLIAASGLLGWLTTRTATEWRFVVQMIAMVLAAFSAVLAVWSVRPRQHRLVLGLTAWGGIVATGNATKYCASILRLADGGLEEIAGHSYALAKILKTKYQTLSVATWVFMFAGLTTIPLLIPVGRARTEGALTTGSFGCRITAELRGLQPRDVFNPNLIELRYVVKNDSDRDYQLPDTFRVLRKTNDGILHADVQNNLGFQTERFFPHHQFLEFFAGLSIGNVFDHAPTEKEKAQLEKQLAGTQSYLVIDEKYPCQFELPIHR